MHQERPESRLERGVCITLAITAVLMGDRLILQISLQPFAMHLWRFVGLALLFGLLLYLGWLVWLLSTVTYAIDGARLLLSQGGHRQTVALDGSVHLYRWRSRWAWSGAPANDLGVGEIDLIPPLWLGRSPAVWVLLETKVTGERRAVAFRPSPALLGMVRAILREREDAAG